jgi:integrative and conjugative element protein (TIGR02256 family)
VKTVVWLPASLLRYIATAAEEWAPKETGGILAGYWSTKHTECVVTHVIGAGPTADHRETGLTPDTGYQESELDRIFAESGGASVYIGEWHSHPNSPAIPSPADRSTLRRIALYSAAQAPRPLVLIVDRLDDQWSVVGWQGRLGPFGRLGWLRVDPVELRVG